MSRTFINAVGNATVLDVVGNGSVNQWSRSTFVGWDEGQPGDLAFLAAPGDQDINHAKIIVAVKDDGYLVGIARPAKARTS